MEEAKAGLTSNDESEGKVYVEGEKGISVGEYEEITGDLDLSQFEDELRDETVQWVEPAQVNEMKLKGAAKHVTFALGGGEPIEEEQVCVESVRMTDEPGQFLSNEKRY